MGAAGRWQVRSSAANVASRDWLTCADVHEHAEHGLVCLADKEEATGSIQGDAAGARTLRSLGWIHGEELLDTDCVPKRLTQRAMDMRDSRGRQ